MQSPVKAPFEWPHAPVHRLSHRGAYMVTAATYQKQPYFETAAKRDLLLQLLLSSAAELDWHLQAWAVLSNHYHFVASSPEHPETLPKLIGKIHTLSARAINKLDLQPGRKVWHQYWDSLITHNGSYLARLQ